MEQSLFIAGLVQPKGVQRKTRRVTQVAEYVKDAKDPGRFQDLLVYDPDVDGLSETKEFSYHSERISHIAHSWDMSVEEAMENIRARAEVKETIVETARKEGRRHLLGANWVVWSNAKFDELMDRHSSRKGIDHKKLLRDWKKWFERKKTHGR